MLNGDTRVSGVSSNLSQVQASGSVGRSAGINEPRLRETQTPGTTPRDTDRVELSMVAQTLSPFLNQLKQNPVRQELVDQIRQQIAAGVYDTPEKLDQALDAMIDDTRAGW